MAKCLFKSRDRNLCHAKLAELLKADPTFAGECRDGEWFTVWDGPLVLTEAERASPPTPDLSKARELVAEESK